MGFKKGGHVGIRGWFGSLKLGRDVRYLNPLQRDMLYFLEFDPAVRRYKEQPLMIKTTLDDGTYHEHVPAFHVVTEHQGTETHLLVECVRQTQLNTHAVKTRLEVSAEWAETHGYRFVVATDQEMATGHYLANVRLLWRYSRTPAQALLTAACIEFLAARPPGTPFQALRQHLDAKCGAMLYDGEYQHTAPPYIYNLLFRHILVANLALPLGSESLLWPAPTITKTPGPMSATPSFGVLAALPLAYRSDRLPIPMPERSPLWLE